MPFFEGAQNVDARHGTMNDFSGGGVYNHSGATNHTDMGSNNVINGNTTMNGDNARYNDHHITHNDYSKAAQSGNSYRSSNSTDDFSKPSWNYAGDTYYSGINAGSNIHGDMNNTFGGEYIVPPNPSPTRYGSNNRPMYPPPMPTFHSAQALGREYGPNQTNTASAPSYRLHGYNPHAQPAPSPPTSNSNSHETQAATDTTFESRYHSVLQQMKEMGFADHSRNVQALKQAAGNVEAAIGSLLS